MKMKQKKVYEVKVNNETIRAFKSNKGEVVNFDIPTITYKMKDVKVIKEIKV